MHKYEVHLLFSSSMTRDEIIASIVEMLPDADYQVAILAPGDRDE